MAEVLLRSWLLAIIPKKSAHFISRFIRLRPAPFSPKRQHGTEQPMDELVDLVRWMFIRAIAGWALVAIGAAVVLTLLYRLALRRRAVGKETELRKVA